MSYIVVYCHWSTQPLIQSRCKGFNAFKNYNTGLNPYKILANVLLFIVWQLCSPNDQLNEFTHLHLVYYGFIYLIIAAVCRRSIEI